MTNSSCKLHSIVFDAREPADENMGEYRELQYPPHALIVQPLDIDEEIQQMEIFPGLPAGAIPANSSTESGPLQIPVHMHARSEPRRTHPYLHPSTGVSCYTSRGSRHPLLHAGEHHVPASARGARPAADTHVREHQPGVPVRAAQPSQVDDTTGVFLAPPLKQRSRKTTVSQDSLGRLPHRPRYPGSTPAPGHLESRNERKVP